MQIIFDNEKPPAKGGLRIITLDDYSDHDVLLATDEIRLWASADGYHLAQLEVHGKRFFWCEQRVSQAIADDLLAMYKDGSSAAIRGNIDT